MEIWSAPKPKMKTKKTCEQCGRPANCCVDVYEQTENPNRYNAVISVFYCIVYCLMIIVTNENDTWS